MSGKVIQFPGAAPASADPFVIAVDLIKRLGYAGALDVVDHVVTHAATPAAAEAGLRVRQIPAPVDQASGILSLAISDYKALLDALARHPRRYRKLERELAATLSGGEAEAPTPKPRRRKTA